MTSVFDFELMQNPAVKEPFSKLGMQPFDQHPERARCAAHAELAK